MKKEFETPECIVVEFDNDDVITTSGNGNGNQTPVEPTE